MSLTMPRIVSLTVGTLVFALGVAAAMPGSASAQEINVIRPGDARPEQRIDVNGSLIAVTHVEDAQQAEAVFFGGQRDRYQRAGSDPQGRPYGLLLTYDMDGRAAFIVLDLSWLRDEDGLGFVNLMLFETGTTPVRNVPGTHESIQVLLQPQSDGTYLAREYRELAKGSKVNNTDWGVREEYTTRDDSINARTDNGPDDDEARAQGPTPRTGDDEDDD